MTDQTCYECSRGARWEKGGRAAKLVELERLERQAAELASQIRSIDTLIANADDEVAEHKATCPERPR